MDAKYSPNESGLEKSESGFMFDVRIPPECMDENGAPCPHSKKEIKREQNPV